jgi:hypothetical protein
MKMKEYTKDDLISLSVKIGKCFYTFNQYMWFIKNIFDSQESEKAFEESVKFRFLYYGDAFLIELYELYDFFDEHKDEAFFGLCITTPEIRDKLRLLRNKIVHVEGDVEKILSKWNEYSQVGDVDNETKDFFAIIRYFRILAKGSKAEDHLVRNFEMIMSLYPPGFGDERYLKEIRK